MEREMERRASLSTTLASTRGSIALLADRCARGRCYEALIGIYVDLADVVRTIQRIIGRNANFYHL